MERGHRKTAVGKVLGDKADKTIMVEVERTIRHPVYEKVIRRRKKLNVHDEENSAKVGDTVRVMETRPLSKTKRWRLLDIVVKSK